MLKIIFHDVLADYYLYLYNRTAERDYIKRSRLIKKAAYHQERLLKLQLKKHISKSKKK
ncbi:hypothetical protein [Salipaludibacillus aurantiacus]|uniref:Uncharacterized protein n=1 Tax=Salipaludibacillus aurantiacus TaxID=1601833 RepID=A0A1H9UBU9_9BACI|nr:hypothetical protein [Salipaludibacillus aurantiacus]SES06812.1 hypothetical protein SAMN05518684_107106 [Salipaludibacillus aurantiacus]